jgi:nucleoside-diphosphate-sugar epimerase
MRVLIIGVTGFIGSAVAAYLHAKGHQMISVWRRCDRSPPSGRPARRPRQGATKACTATLTDAARFCWGRDVRATLAKASVYCPLLLRQHP